MEMHCIHLIHEYVLNSWQIWCMVMHSIHDRSDSRRCTLFMTGLHSTSDPSRFTSFIVGLIVGDVLHSWQIRSMEMHSINDNSDPCRCTPFIALHTEIWSIHERCDPWRSTPFMTDMIHGDALLTWHIWSMSRCTPSRHIGYIWFIEVYALHTYRAGPWRSTPPMTDLIHKDALHLWLIRPMEMHSIPDKSDPRGCTPFLTNLKNGDGMYMDFLQDSSDP